MSFNSKSIAPIIASAVKNVIFAPKPFKAAKDFVAKFKLFRIETIAAGYAVTWHTYGFSGRGFNIDWGDGHQTHIDNISSDDVVTASHTYGSTPGTKLITFFGDLDSITGLECSDGSIRGQLSGFAKATNLEYLVLARTSLTGDIKCLKRLRHLKWFLIDSYYVTGDIVWLSKLRSLQYFAAHSGWGTAPVYGDVEVLAGQDWSYLHLGNVQQISGDIGSLRRCTNLTLLDCSNSVDVVGVVNDLLGLSELEYLWLAGTRVSVIDAPLGNWGGASSYIYMHGCMWTADEVDNFLINFDASSTKPGGYLKMDGNNAARTSASDTAKANLIAKGWTIYVNE
jgi:hypothetical protein